VRGRWDVEGNPRDRMFRATRSPWLAMELLEGENLHERVANGGPIALPVARTMFAQLQHALGAAHDRGVIPRDLKPENILIAFFTLTGLDYWKSAHGPRSLQARSTPCSRVERRRPPRPRRRCRPTR